MMEKDRFFDFDEELAQDRLNLEQQGDDESQ